MIYGSIGGNILEHHFAVSFVARTSFQPLKNGLIKSLGAPHRFHPFISAKCYILYIYVIPSYVQMFVECILILSCCCNINPNCVKPRLVNSWHSNWGVTRVTMWQFITDTDCWGNRYPPITVFNQGSLRILAWHHPIHPKLFDSGLASVQHVPVLWWREVQQTTGRDAQATDVCCL